MVSDTDTLSPAIESLIGRFAGPIDRAARRYGLPREDVDELIQDVRVRLWRALRVREKTEQLPASYVYRTAVSAALDLIRRRRHAWREDPLESAVDRRATRLVPNAADAAIASSEVIEQIEEALRSITESRQLVVRMHLAGYHRNEIAKRLGWSEAKTRNLLYRGLEELRMELTRRGIRSAEGGT